MLKLIIILLTHANVWELMGKPCSCTQFVKSRIFLLQVMRKSVSGTASHTRIRIRYYKSRVCVWTRNEIEGLYDEIIITIVP